MIIKTAHVQLVDGTEDLVIEVVFEVDGWGEYPVSFMGKDVRTLHQALGEVIAQYPTLCGTVREKARSETITVPGYAPGKATTN